MYNCFHLPVSHACPFDKLVVNGSNHSKDCPRYRPRYSCAQLLSTTFWCSGILFSVMTCSAMTKVTSAK